MSQYKTLDLFAGIGGFTLGLERAGFKTVAFCEIEPYSQKVLAKHWPGVPIYNDVKELTNDRLEADGIFGIDVITGGFPCQDISVAGKQAGISEGTRSGLWSEVSRLIDDIQPRYAIMENVTALISGDSGRWFGRVLGDLAEIGYDAEWHCISASEIGAHHHRDRVWIIAYPQRHRVRPNARAESRPKNERQKLQQKNREPLPVNTQEICSNVAYPTGKLKPSSIDESKIERGGKIASEGPECVSGRSSKPLHISNTDSKRGRSPEDAKNVRQSSIGEGIDLGRVEMWDAEPGVGRVANGVPGRSHRLKGLGNAVVPQLPEIIGRAIMQHEKAILL